MSIIRLAQRLFFLKPLLNFCFVAGIVAIVALFIYGSIETQNNYAIACLLFAVWSLLFSALIGLLAQKPMPSQENIGWLAGIKSKFFRAVFSLTLILFIAISLALLYASIKLLNL